MRAALTRWMGGVAAFGVVLSGLALGAAPALAAPNPAIVVADVVLTTSDGGQATVGDVIGVSGTWDASAADPRPGDTFAIELPTELAFPQPIPFPLLGADGTVWANCVTDVATSIATCELTAAVTARPEEVKGTFSFDVVAEVATTETAVDFGLNGVVTAVPLPGGGGIDDGITLPTGWDKSGSMNDDKYSMSWTINLPGSRMAGRDVVRVLEQVSDNHVLCTPSQLKVETVRGSTVVDVTSIAAVDTAPAAPYDFAFVLTAPTGGFDPNVTYRITYDTCTPDGLIDPKGTVYDNEATVDVFGESSGVIGVTQDWAFSGVVNKEGTVLGGAERNGTTRWTVTIDGDHLAGKNAFALTEALSGPHAVCPDTVSGIRIYERYGPSAAQQREITDLLTVSAVTTPTTISAQVSVNAGSGFSFRPADYLYLIVYDTCSTTDGLPEAGTQFGNSVTVDGATTGATATVPGRSEGKGGSINTGSVTLDGVQYFPQTTMNWSVRVPGEKLAALGGDLTIVDTLTSAHQVCGTGPDAAARLGLKIEAQDQITGGGLATVDLTGSASTVLGTDSSGAQQFTITVPQPTLPLPGGGSATGFSREYQYVISYTTCTTSGGMDAPGTTYGNTASVNGISYSQTVTQSNRGSGTGQGVTRGSVSISKALASTDAAAFVPADTSYTVHVKELDPQGTVQVEYDLAVKADGTPVSGFNPRGNGWTAELSEPTFPAVPGVTFGAPRFTASPGVIVSPDGTVATVALTPNTNIAVSVTNTALLGSVAVTKSVQGGAAALVDPDQEFSVRAVIDTSALGAGFPAQPDRVVAVKAGTPVTLDELPVGATVRFSETLPADDDVLTWSPAAITPDSIVVEPAFATTPGQIAVVNTVERTVGTFSVLKRVTGDQAANPAVPATVTVTASWEADPARGQAAGGATLTVPTDGTPVALGSSLLVGTQVRLTETPLVDGSSIAWSAPIWSGTGVSLDGASAVVTVGRTAGATVTLENVATTSTAGIQIIKGVGGAAAGEVDADEVFPVTATWTDATGTAQSRQLEVDAKTPTPLGVQLPAGTVVTLTEGDRPAYPTVVWGSIGFAGTGVTDGGAGSATVVVSTQQSATTLVTLTNEADWAPGTLSLAKAIEGIRADHPDLPASVEVEASWLDANLDPQSTTLTLPLDGTVVPLGLDLPHLTEVTLRETDAAHGAGFTWATPEWAGTDVLAQPDGSAIVTIRAAADPRVQLTNTAVTTLGRLSVTKSLTGAAAGDVAADTAYPLTVSWTDLLGVAQERTLTVQAGQPTVIDEVPAGTPMTIVEGAATLPQSVRWNGAQWSTTDDAVTLAADGATASVVLDPAATDAAVLDLANDMVAAPTLAATGTAFAATAGLTLGTVLLLVGGGLLITRMRRLAPRR